QPQVRSHIVPSDARAGRVHGSKQLLRYGIAIVRLALAGRHRAAGAIRRVVGSGQKGEPEPQRHGSDGNPSRHRCDSWRTTRSLTMAVTVSFTTFRHRSRHPTGKKAHPGPSGSVDATVTAAP